MNILAFGLHYEINEAIKRVVEKFQEITGLDGHISMSPISNLSEEGVFGTIVNNTHSMRLLFSVKMSSVPDGVKCIIYPNVENPVDWELIIEDEYTEKLADILAKRHIESGNIILTFCPLIDFYIGLKIGSMKEFKKCNIYETNLTIERIKNEEDYTIL